MIYSPEDVNRQYTINLEEGPKAENCAFALFSQ